MFSIVWDHYHKSGINNGIGLGAGFHFLSGPDQTDMPASGLRLQPRLPASPAARSAGIRPGRGGLGGERFQRECTAGHPLSRPCRGLPHRQAGDRPGLRRRLSRPRRHQASSGGRADLGAESRHALRVGLPAAAGDLSTDRHAIASIWPASWAAAPGRSSARDLGNDLATYRDLRVCVGLEYVERTAVGWPSRSATCSIAAWNTPPASAT